FDNLSQSDSNELVEARIKKEENRLNQRWPDEKIAIENGRWGPFIRRGKKMLKLERKPDEWKYTPEEAAKPELEDVKRMIEGQVPGAFTKKTPAKKAAKKAPAKKTARKKAPKKRK